MMQYGRVCVILETDMYREFTPRRWPQINSSKALHAAAYGYDNHGTSRTDTHCRDTVRTTVKC